VIEGNSGDTAANVARMTSELRVVDGRSLQFGRTSAPIMPHLVQMALGSRSKSTVSSGQPSALMTGLWWQSPVEQ
jgi:hypothetical protein